MSMQVNIRLEDVIVEELDGWAVIRGISRPELIRDVLTLWLKRQRSEEIAEEYRKAYEKYPETEEQLARADSNLRRLVEEEPWEPWW